MQLVYLEQIQVISFWHIVRFEILAIYIKLRKGFKPFTPVLE